MEDVAGIGADLGVGVDVCHNIVPPPPLVHFRPREIDVVNVRRAIVRSGQG